MVYKNEIRSVLPVDSGGSMGWIQCSQLTIPCQLQLPTLVFIAPTKRK